ncbi:MAG: UvrD-helicase domain-containing protein [Chloroflexi bacterium]|nr:UvrD-helicase domain-containing protein [Chloroflexota bacterium]
MTSILSLLGLRERQTDAVAMRDRHMSVTAGAGSGKTRALVGRYLALLEDGAPLRSLVAITFTEKAAREMRSRIRQFIGAWQQNEGLDAERRAFWADAYAQLDNARIGTIHALCAAILRAHPAEAGLDPAFEVLDENNGAVLRARAVETALAWTANDGEAAALFGLLPENGLRDLLGKLLGAADAWPDAADTPAAWQANRSAAIADALAAFAATAEVSGALDALAALRAGGALVRVAGDKLAPQVETLLELWGRIEPARAAAQWDRALEQLFVWRRTALPGRAGKAGAAKDAVKELREAYDAQLDPWLGGKDSKDAPPRWALDVRAGEALPLLRRALNAARGEYDRLKNERRALDFDDLEARTDTLLLGTASVRARWQAELRAVLVDEFQDTNERQRRIVYALCGLSDAPASADAAGARLFIVGDAKQSIYRFRGADVTVFRTVQADLARRGGTLVDFDLTYRAHQPLVTQFNTLLRPILGAADDPARPYAVPYAPLRAYRPAPHESTHAPFIELCLGIGADAATAREAAAAQLATRLRALHDDEQIRWGAMALLFRASTNFPLYEDALEQAGIPYVTVAGKGFYDRPEVRDLLNLLAAVANPADDLALAGALRSPAFGLSDATLYRLRWAEGAHHPRALWPALCGDVAWLGDEAAAAARTRDALGRVSSLVGRVGVAAVLKALLDESDYRGSLRRLGARQPALQRYAERAARNVDKLLADAHASELVSPAEFVEYVASMRDLAAREGEAPVEAGESVQLMTVHKAKGLEFDLVVIADAAHASRGAVRLLLDPRLGPLFPMEADGARSVLHRLAAIQDADQADAEERRLLYVAATRAREKLIVSGHLKRKVDGQPALDGWLAWIGAEVGLDALTVPENLVAPLPFELPGLAGAAACVIAPVRQSPVADAPSADQPWPAAAPSTIAVDLATLVAPLPASPPECADEKVQAAEAAVPARVWRVVPTTKAPRGPAWVVGLLAHEALRRWRFPDRADFYAYLYPHALSAGLIDPAEITDTINVARRLLERFQAHPLFAEMDAAQRLHELPYVLERGAELESGVIDVLYRPLADDQAIWRIVDFKTDEIRSEEQLAERADQYGIQLGRYVTAVRDLLGVDVQGSLCFLDVRGQLRMAPAAPAPGK